MVTERMIEAAFRVFSDRMLMREEDKEFIGRVLEAALSTDAEPAMFVSEQQLSQCVGHYVPSRKTAEGNFQLALYRAPPAPSVAVKALEWTTPNPSTTYPEWRTMGLGFEAVIDKSQPLFYGDFPLRINGRHTSEKFDTLETAKAFAQADYEARIRSALSAQVQDVAIPEGWQLVPKEPTSEMTLAGQTWRNAKSLFDRNDEFHVYRAMLAAAPAAKQDVP